MPYIKVALDVPLPKVFDYSCAEAAPHHVGLRVRVPFGAKQAVGVIMAVTDAPTIDPSKVRPAREILSDLAPLPEDLLELLRFVSDYYHHPIGEVVLAALPTRYRSGTTRRTVATVAISSDGSAALRAGLDRSPVAAAMLAMLESRGPLGERELAELPPAQRRALRRLVARGFARLVAHTASPVAAPASMPPTLTAEQSAFVAGFSESADRFRTWLLHGITGSGKTEVYLAVMARVVAASRQVLLLVPEIGLTPQLEATLRARFPACPLVTLHSSLAASQRADNWAAAQRGAARIVVGTRSAVFAPLPRLGLIVVDEEHDVSYKQNEGVRYSARDLAIWRARQRDVPIILGSATPSLESYAAASGGRYTLARLTQRPNAATLPTVKLVSTAALRIEGGVAPAMLAAIEDRVARREQVLVFINRRGYAPVLLCYACGWAPVCPRCAAHTVLHRTRTLMLCHHCGREEAVPASCTQCGNADLQPVGFGTQRIEATIRSALPAARLLRVDRDTTRTREAWPRMRQAIVQREVDVLVGTQLLSKGHDFEGVSLVCVLNADRSLYSTDFRASEQLFAQLLQVSGRAGRGALPGEVLIQTAFASHPLYAAVCAHDYDAFARMLFEERRLAGLPPFVYQALLRAEAPRSHRALDFLAHAAGLAAPLAAGVSVYDPAPAAMPRLQGRERAQLLVQSQSRTALHRFLDRWCLALWDAKTTRARWVLDVDPLEI
jgi:primosomal protein N' (replication factor Y) (superfamily II helicase)